MGKTIHVSGFPHRIGAKTAKNFLERFTGQGTVIALEVEPLKRGTKAYAQFTTTTCAEIIIKLANTALYYDTYLLEAWEMDYDIVKNPRTFAHEMESVTLNFGCQISEERFSVIWREAYVSVQFESGLKKMHFYLRRNSVEYRLQLSYENVWQIVLFNARGRAKLLLIQLFGAPRIYKKLEDSVYSYLKHTPDDQWVRTTDFTPSIIGQSSGFCLQFPPGVKLPNFKDNFVYCKENEHWLFLENGIPFCEDAALVPIIQPPLGLKLPYRILFQICRLVQTGCIPGPNLDRNFFDLVNPQRFDIRYIEHALDKLYYMKECCYYPAAWLGRQYYKYRILEEIPKSPAICLDDGLVYVHRVHVTPTKVYFSGPEINVSNRVLRQFHHHIDNFLRVSFVDEEWDKMYSADLAPKVAENKRTKLYERVLLTLRNGIRIGNKKFDFLAFSSSQVRENALWMFAPTNKLNADGIRQWMGDFSSIKNVAKYSARLGQSFGSSKETLTVGADEIEIIDDVILSGTEYIFSDGIGKISADFAEKVAVRCGVRDFVPSAFQIRYRGYKGVVAVDPNSSVKLSLRPSMLKYQSNNTKLDVLAWSKYQPCFLNRQIITLLSTMGVSDHVFEKKQKDAVAQLDDMLVDSLNAEEALDLMSPGEYTNILKEMLKCGYKPDGEPFLRMMLQTFRSSKLLDLRVKARIFVPKARRMIGCLDETGTLEYGEVFVQFSGAGRRSFSEESVTFNECISTNSNYILKEKVVVARNPCLHPGDVRVLTAIDVPALHHMVDCVVFPAKGNRPHPNECSGGDLDGDLYFVCWDPDLIPPKQVPPMNYDPAPNTQLDHDVTIEEVAEYFTNYILNDSLGIISNAHAVFADKDNAMALSKNCLELARLFSIAVDFPKTGIAAEIPPKLRVKVYPDFMEKPDKKTYESKRIIGKLFREVKDISPSTASLKSFTKEAAMRSYDTDMEVEGYKDYISKAFEYKTDYDNKLGNLMEHYGIKTEAEILGGSIMGTSNSFDRRKDADAISAAARSLRNEAKSWFNKGNKLLQRNDVYAKASAWYHVTYHPDYWGCYNKGLNRDHYISFPWCVYDKLVQIKKKNSSRRDISSLIGQFRQVQVLDQN